MAVRTTAAARRPRPPRDGGLALVVAPLLGELTAGQVRVARRRRARGRRHARGAASWCPTPRVAAAELAAAGLVVDAGSPAAGVSACAGRPGCAKSLADVRADARAALGHAARRPARTGSAATRRCGAPRAAHVDAVALAGGGYRVDGVPRPGLAP